MRQAGTIAIVAALEAFTAWLWQVLHWPPVAWIVLCTGLVAVGIGAGFPGLLGKRADGSVAPWSYLLFWPWHLHTWSLAWTHRYAFGGPVTEVHPGWWIGGWPRASDLPPRAAVLDLTCELRCRVRAEAYLCVPTWDGTAPTLEELRRAVRWAVEQRAEGRPVLVHCAHGRGRSATVLLAALVEAGEFVDWRSARRHVRERRRIGPNRAQQALLEAWQRARG